MTLKGLTTLVEHEGFRDHAYQDSELFWTIGYGHLIDKRKGGRIKEKFLHMIFEDDVADKTQECKDAFPWFEELDPVRQDVIVNLTFNLGIEGLKGFKRMIEAIVQQQWAQAAWELSNSKWKTQVQKDRHDDLTFALEKARWRD